MTNDEKLRELHVSWLKERIEALSDTFPMYGRTAYTHRRTHYMLYVQEWRPEQEGYRPLPKLFGDMAENLLISVRAYASVIKFPLLIWRKEPLFEVSADGSIKLTCRLAFETDLNAQPDDILGV